MSQNVKVVADYFKALSTGDYETAGTYWSDDLVWHQPGKSPLAGSFKGKEAVFAHLADFAKLSNGSFAIDSLDYITDNNDLVLASIHFKASANNLSIEMKGVDLFRIEDGKIHEIWLFSEKLEQEDNFWASLANK